MIYPFIQQIFVGYLLRIRWPSRHWNTDDGQSGWHFPFRTDLPLTSPCQPATLPPSLPTVPRLFLLLGTLHFVKSYWLFVQSLSHVQFFVTPWTVAHQASLSFIISWNFLKFMSIEFVMPSNHLILCCPLILLLLLPSIFPNIGIFSSESALHIRWPKYWSFSFSISCSNEYSGLISFRTDWFDLLGVQGRTASQNYNEVSLHTS